MTFYLHSDTLVGDPTYGLDTRIWGATGDVRFKTYAPAALGFGSLAALFSPLAVKNNKFIAFNNIINGEGPHTYCIYEIL